MRINVKINLQNSVFKGRGQFAITIYIKSQFVLMLQDSTCTIGSPHILSSDMLEGLLRQTSMVQGEVVQWSTEQVVVVQWGTEQGVAFQELGVVPQEDKGKGVAEDRTCGTGGEHIVQSGRQPPVAYFEGASREEFDPWVAARDRLYLVYLTQLLGESCVGSEPDDTFYLLKHRPRQQSQL